MQSYECAILKPEDSAWTRLLERCAHDVYHLPEYSRIVADEQGGEACALWIKNERGELLVPLIRSALPAAIDATRGLRDAASPYGYGSPVWVSENEDFIFDIPDLIKRAAAQSQLVAIFIRLHPILSRCLAQHSAVSPIGPVVVVDLLKSSTDLEAAIKPVHRRAIRKLERAGYVSRVSEGSQVTPRQVENFANLYLQTMQRVGATQTYFFSDDYFRSFFEKLGSKAGLLEVEAPGGATACSIIFTNYAGLVNYHLSGTDPAHLKHSPLKLAIRDLIVNSCRGGVTALNLGGGVGSKRDSLFQFKQGFSAYEEVFRVMRIVSSGEYGRLCAQASSMRGAPVALGGYFPDYRASL